MSTDTYEWVKAAHVIGFILWTAGLMSCVQLLGSHAVASVDSREALTRAERKVALGMDIGAFIAIVAGLYLALGSTPNAFEDGAWLHVKLTVVALGIIGLHGFVRVKIRKFRRGQIAPLASFVYPLTVVIIAATVILAVVKPLR